MNRSVIIEACGRGKFNFMARVMLILMACGAVGFGCSKRSATIQSKYGGTQSVSGEQGKTVPAAESGRPLAATLELRDREGRMQKLSDLSGQVVLVHFWASWCPPCLPEIPEILNLAQKFEGKNVIVLAVSTDDKLESALKIFPAGTRFPKNLMILSDSGAVVADRYGSYMYPETYLLSREQRVLKKWVGPQQWDSEQIHGEIQNALN